MRKLISLFFSAVVLMCVAASLEVRTPLARPSLASARDSIRPDSLLPPAADSTHVRLPDSLALPSDTFSLPSDSLRAASAVADSLAADSTAAKRRDGLDAPVDFAATDSMVYDAETRQLTLFGKAQVKYENMTLDAGRISMNMDSSIVHATTLADTSKEQMPLFHQGSDEYESERMSYNFKTKKGFISNVSTTQGNGYVQSTSSKRAADGTVYMEKATYTTCDAPHPHFYMQLSRAKVVPGKETVFGPAHLVVADVPLPLGVPYGFFPFSKKYSSGFVMPSYGDEMTRGFYLRDGGYYFALSDFADLTLLGEVYTKGSWGLSAETHYRKRYRHNGNFFVSYLNTVEGEKNLPDYLKTTSLKVQWTHTKDKAAGGNTSFSARVNFASQNYERKNLTSMYNPLSYTQSTRASSVSFSHSFPGLGLTLSGSSNLTQNMRDSTIAMTLPDLSISLARFYPFRRKHQVGKERWYEKISLSYTGQLSNSITAKEDQILHSNLVKDWRNGMQHNVPIDATFQLFKYVNISPSLTLRDLTYTNRIMRTWDAEALREVADTTYGLYNLYSWNAAVSANTTLYGFYKPWRRLFGDKIEAIRHVFKPSVSFTYAPDFTTAHYGYVRHYTRTDADGNSDVVTYSPYQRGLYGYPSATRQGLVTMSVSNNVEAKVRRGDTVRKVSIIDELSGSLSYNMAAKERPWSNLSTRLRLKLTKSYTFSMAAVFATYAYAFNERGQVVTGNRTEWSYGRFGRFGGMSQNLSYTFNNQTFSKLAALFSGADRKEQKPDAEAADEEADIDDANIDPDLLNNRKQGRKATVKAKTDADGYLSFSMPWSLTLSYGITMFEDRSRPINVRTMRYPYGFTQTLNANGYLRVADGWNISFSSGYDFEQKKVSMTTASLSRDLHCFEMSCSVVLRPYSSFNFSFRARASELADALKWDKRSSYSSNIEWY